MQHLTFLNAGVGRVIIKVRFLSTCSYDARSFLFAFLHFIKVVYDF